MMVAILRRDMFVKLGMKECLSCGYTMFGVYSYEIREICKPCGGKAKCDEVKEDGERQGQKKSAH